MPGSTDDVLRSLPADLWQRLRGDPVRAPEHLALAAARTHAPAAAAWAARRRATYATTPPELAMMAKKRHAGLARAGGAATGIGGMITVLPDLASLAWIQSRLVFFVAAAYGYDPHDPMRPAELLVLQGLYHDPVAARGALDGVGRPVAHDWVSRKLSADKDKALVTRLMRTVGTKTGKRVAGRFIPGVAVVFNAVGNERNTRALADRAIRFYGG